MVPEAGSDRDQPEALTDDEPPDGLVYWAWTLIANAFEGNWTKALPEWREAAMRWRDAFHESLDAERAGGVEPATGDPKLSTDPFHSDMSTQGGEMFTDPVNHPSHYTAHPAGIECIEVVEHMTFNVGNAIKYLWRAGLKDGEDPTRDLAKARWYVEREIERLLTAQGHELMSDESPPGATERPLTAEGHGRLRDLLEPLRAMVPCDRCHGAGRLVPRTGEPPATPEELNDMTTMTCPVCHGSGEREIPDISGVENEAETLIFPGQDNA